MNKLIVLDTCAIISYFTEVFKEPSSISAKSLGIIKKVFSNSGIKAIIPSIVFIELYEVFGHSEEDIKRIYYEVIQSIIQCESIEIRPFDRDVLFSFIKINDRLEEEKFDNHDKQILATAMSMRCVLVTSDRKILSYNNRKNVIPGILI